MSGNTFADQWVFITGAGSGIGYETAIAFAEKGANIVAVDLSSSGLQDLVPRIEALGRRCRTEILDVTDMAAYRALVAKLDDDGCVPDIVINNAGLGFNRPFEETSIDEWRLTLDVNVLGVVAGCRNFLKLWKEHGRTGHLVNISSMASYSPVPGMSAYAASKYAVEGLSEVLAMELDGTGIAVSCVHPGIINTPIVHDRSRTSASDSEADRLQAYYRNKGVPPRTVADDIVAGVSRKAGTILSGKDTFLTALLKRLLPKALYRRLLISKAREIGFLPKV